MTATAFPIVYVAELERSVQFYRENFGFEEAYQWPVDGEREFVAMTRGDAAVGFSSLAAAARTMGAAVDRSPTPSFELCLYVDDVDATSDDLRSSGVRQISAPTDRPWGERSAYFADPDGNPVQIVTPLPSRDPA